MLHNHQSTNNSPSYAAPSSSDAASSQNKVVLPPKRKRRPAGTPDPDAEVVCLSPKTLLESDRYVCEICKLGFQREQNLQMHKRRHKVPWKLVKKERENSREQEVVVVKKKVFVCPEPSCLHHHPSHALGDLVGIKKHFRRKHSNHKQWVCHKCSKAYAVHSDFKAHLKTCGTRGHSCDCGRVFSRVESFIEHQDACNKLSQPSSSRTASSTSPSSEPNFNIVAIPPLLLQGFPLPTRPPPPPPHKHSTIRQELQLLRCSSLDNNHESETHLKLSIGSCSNGVEAVEEVKLAMEEKANAEEARREAKREIEMAEFEFGKAKKLRKEAQEEVHKAQAFKNQTMVNISSTLLQITCQACKKHFQSSMLGLSSQETSMVMNDP